MLYYNYKKVFYFRKICVFIKETIRNLFLLRLCFKEIFDFQALQVPSWNARSFSSLESDFLRKMFWNVFFEGENVWSVFFEEAILKIYFMRKQFWESNFWKYFDKCLTELLIGMSTSFYCFNSICHEVFLSDHARGGGGGGT